MPKYYKIEQADLRNPGRTRETYRVLHEGNITAEDFINHIARHSSLSKSMLTAVLIEVADELGELLATGDSVTLPGIGNFSIGVRATKASVADDDHELNAQSIEFDHINFRCSRRLKNDVASRCGISGFERVGGREGVKIKKPSMLIKGRLASAREYLKNHHVMRVADYAELVKLSYSAAQRELKAAAQESSSGIKASGSGNQRVYVLDEGRGES